MQSSIRNIRNLQGSSLKLSNHFFFSANRDLKQKDRSKREPDPTHPHSRRENPFRPSLDG